MITSDSAAKAQPISILRNGPTKKQTAIQKPENHEVSVSSADEVKSSILRSASTNKKPTTRKSEHDKIVANSEVKMKSPILRNALTKSRTAIQKPENHEVSANSAGKVACSLLPSETEDQQLSYCDSSEFTRFFSIWTFTVHTSSNREFVLV